MPISISADHVIVLLSLFRHLLFVDEWFLEASPRLSGRVDKLVVKVSQ